MNRKKILRAEHITKSFFGNTVLDDVDFDLYEGEVHTILGENGAGKSTFLKILSGVYAKDHGEVYLDDQLVEIHDIRKAQEYGISMIFQELNVLTNLSVHENIFLGKEFKRYGILQDRRSIQRSKELLENLNVSIDPLAQVGSLKISDRQLVEIAKSLSCDARIIIMDEPTSSLSEKEIQSFFLLINRLKSEMHISFIFISHRLQEIQEISDRITILRDGKRISTIDLHTETYDEQSIVKQMVGRDIGSFYVVHGTQELTGEQGPDLLNVEQLSSGSSYKNISFSVKEGEVLGIAGLVGAGRSELLSSIVGLHPYESGHIRYFGKQRRVKTPFEAIKLGIGFVPEDRKELGLIVNMNLRENTSLSVLRSISHVQLIDRVKDMSIARDSIKMFGIKAQGTEGKITYLSGGNQQKVTLAKAMNTRPRILLLDEPTRGVDVNAKREIYAIISKLVEQGISVVMVSSELPEIFGISDRIMVMFEGRKTGEFINSEEHHENVMKALLGVAHYEE
jgi:ABC-type sugar transport system ATPase subunit